MHCAYFTWDPERVFFVMPLLHHPVTWYGFLFACGFFAGYFLIRYLFMCHLKDQGRKEGEARLEAVVLSDRLTFLVVMGTLVGARLGHVFFYEWPYYKTHLVNIFKIWEGGLASHGGALGILIALIIFVCMHRKKFPSFTFLATLDALVIPAALAGGCIRIGNFINQEILGVPTSLPWGVIFLHPVEGIAGIPLHPVQIYESLYYFLTAGFLYFFWKTRGKKIGLGALSGWFFLLIFGFRFLIEYIKQPQSLVINETHFLNMGQLLSIPFIILGVILLVGYWRLEIKSLKN